MHLNDFTAPGHIQPAQIGHVNPCSQHVHDVRVTVHQKQMLWAQGTHQAQNLALVTVR